VGLDEGVAGEPGHGVGVRQAVLGFQLVDEVQEVEQADAAEALLAAVAEVGDEAVGEREVARSARHRVLEQAQHLLLQGLGGEGGRRCRNVGGRSRKSALTPALSHAPHGRGSRRELPTPSPVADGRGWG
jgi:hypothetical protein